jgi:hypothetical protein
MSAACRQNGCERRAGRCSARWLGAAALPGGRTEIAAERDFKTPQTAQSRPVISRLENRLKYAFVISALRLIGNTGLARPFTLYFTSLRRSHRAWAA